MRTIPAAMQAALDSGATTHCHCWIVTRGDGARFGFTDHDRDIVLDGVTCRADSGLSASEATARFGLSVGGMEITGALSDDALSEADLAAGRFDGAEVVQWLVDWSDPSLRFVAARASLGEVSREGAAFTAELRGAAHRLNETHGRLFASACSADLGDARCRVALSGPTFTASGAVNAPQGRSAFSATGLGAFADGWFTAGRLLWTGGANSGVAVEVKLHRVAAGAVQLSLWQAMSAAIAPGDAFTVSAGCDKRFATCRDRFANAVNFRGFPAIPGNDFVMSYPNSGQPGQTGAPLPSQSK